MRSLQRIVEGTIINHRMLNQGDTVVLAVSGGPDSVCLLHLMVSLATKWRWKIHVAHIHHGIRAMDADEDARFVASFSAQMKCPFHLHRADVPKLAEQRGQGLEETGRYVRYRFLMQLAGEIGAQAIATGHHADDQAETVLMNLLRGAGETGLSGIQPIRLLDHHQKLIRPLLSVTRQEIEHYLDIAQIKACHDHTNDELEQTRNRIRHQLLPELRRYNPRISEALTRTADILRSDEIYLMQQMDNYLADNLIKKYGLLSLSAQKLEDQPLALRRRIVRRMVELVSWEANQGAGPIKIDEPYRDIGMTAHISYAQIEGLLDLLQASSLHEGSSGRSWTVPLPAGASARLSQGQLFFLTKRDTQASSWGCDWRGIGELILQEIDCRLRIREVDRPEGGWDRRVHLKRSLLEQTVHLRAWQPGDRIGLDESAGSKKLSDLFIDAKVPAPYRSRIPIVESGGEIMAVAGLLVASAYRPCADEPVALELQLLNAVF